MVDEKKADEKPQAPAQADQKPVTEEKKDEKQVKSLTGLHQFTAEDLKDFYKKSPQMFEEAGIVKKEEKKTEEPAPKPDAKPQSAAPAAKYRDVEIKLPVDVEVNAEAVKPFFDHWTEVGLSPEQVQKEVDFMAKRAREEKKIREENLRKQETPAQRAQREDSENVNFLKADPAFGKDFDKNMEISRRAALKYGNKDMLARMTTTDPVTVKHFWDLGKLDTEDHTTRGSPRTGNEEDDRPDDNPRSEKALKGRYKNTPQMFHED